MMLNITVSILKGQTLLPVLENVVVIIHQLVLRVKSMTVSVSKLTRRCDPIIKVDWMKSISGVQAVVMRVAGTIVMHPSRRFMPSKIVTFNYD